MRDLLLKQFLDSHVHTCCSGFPKQYGFGTSRNKCSRHTLRDLGDGQHHDPNDDGRNT